MSDRQVHERVRGVVEPALREQGFELVDVERAGPVLRVTVDREGGIDLDGVTTATRLVNDLLDRHALIGDTTGLEVSSPGVERPLRTPEQFLRFIGTEVNVKTRPGTDGERRVTGRLTHADGSGVVITGAGLPESGRRLAYTDIERARTTFQWGPTDPGRGGQRGARRRPHHPSPTSTKKASTS